MDIQDFLTAFLPYQLVMTWLKNVMDELAKEGIVPDLQNIIDFDPWQVLDWGESVMWQLEISPGEWYLDCVPNIFDCDPYKLGDKIIEYKDSIDMLRYDLGELYGETAVSAIELADQELIKYEEELFAFCDKAPGW